MHFSAEHTKTYTDTFRSMCWCRIEVLISSHLLRIVGHVWQHGGHVEHDLVALVGGVEGVGARGVGWRKKFNRQKLYGTWPGFLLVHLRHITHYTLQGLCIRLCPSFFL